MNKTQSALTGVCLLLPAVTSGTSVAATVTTLHTFTLQEESNYPFTGVVVVNNLLYGTTAGGGSNNSSGTVYKIDLTTNTESTIYAFKGGTTDGADPSQLAVLGGRLYGTTLSGGKNNTGIVFEVDPTDGTETVLHSFQKRNNAQTFSYRDPLIVFGGALYGTTMSGGANDLGLAFKITPGGTFTNLHNFSSGAGGCTPAAGLAEHDAVLYGTTDSCGGSGVGTLFSLVPSSKAFHVLYTFPHGQPDSRVVYAAHALFGTITSGGANYAGTVYRIDLATGDYRSLYDFTRSETNIPSGGVAFLGGKLYGLLVNDINGTGNGEAYSVDVKTGAKQDIPFSGNNSAAYGNLYYYKGSLYGTTSNNNLEDSFQNGTVYALTP